MTYKNGKFRAILVVAIVLLVFISYLITLMRLQLVNGDYYKEQSEKKIYSTETITASRGGIYDCNGVSLVNNTTGYCIKFTRALMPKAQQNDIILSLIRLMQEHETAYYDRLPITKTQPFAYTTEDMTDAGLKKLFSTLKLKHTPTAEETMAALIKEYDLENYTPEEQRLIAGVRYEMTLTVFSLSTPYEFAEDISVDLVATIKQLADEYPGVDIDTKPLRSYVDPTVAPHLLGYVGKIWAEEYEDLAAKGYKMNDTIGKAGIESAMEAALKGQDGTRVIERDSSGKVLNVTVLEEAQSGNNVVLTLDSKLQKVAQDSLKSCIETIVRRSKEPGRDGEDANAGAVVAVNIHSGAILASATYPTYTQDEFNNNYTALSTDELKPLWNRAFYGTYAPGSTFKMATGIAALEEGAVGLKETIRDTGIYMKYKPSYTPRCWVYSDYGRGHGLQDIVAALKNSCNYYFYEAADRLGIEALNRYCRKLGLGIKTGVEIGESGGILAGPDYRATIDEYWYPGDTLQAAIGQSDNLFTPLQLANYVATIVNGGTRYKTHLVQGVYDASTGVCVEEENIQVMDSLQMKDENYHAIMQGMLECATSGTAAGVFGYSYAITAGAKTGTASVPKGTANGIFVAFAPYENPQIAVCVVVEHGAHGNYVGSVARDIFDAYFADVTVESPITQENVLLP
ncbi:MAG: hypothetical protein IJP27_02250 [Clostridia bacterium]|nr:hypothetical protein [Clostridia bacterium]